MKKLLALLLALLLLSGCAVVPGETESRATEQTVPKATSLNKAPSVPQDIPVSELKVSRQVLPTTVDNPENLPVLKWVCLTNTSVGSNRVWSENALIEFNQMLADRAIPFRLQLVIYTSDQFVNISGYFLDHPDIRQDDLQSADIINGYMSKDDASNLLMPITNYVTGAQEPSLKNAVPHDNYWASVAVGSEIYGVPTEKKSAYSLGWVVDKELMEKVGLKDTDFQKNFWEMDEVFEKIQKSGYSRFVRWGMDTFGESTAGRNGDIWSIAPGKIMLPLSQYFARCGSLFGIDKESGQVVNIMDTEFTRNLQLAANRYVKAGYLASESGSTKVELARIWSYKACDNAYGEKRLIPINSSIYDVADSDSLARLNGITKKSSHKEEALSLLKLLAEDEALMMQFAYGKEGRDYTIDEMGYYHLSVNEDGSNYSMCHLAIMSGFAGIILLENSRESRMVTNAIGATDVRYEGKDWLESHREQWDNAEKRYMVTFDYTGFEEEADAIRRLAVAKFSSFSNMTPERYDKMIADFNAAGADKILASLQKQYDQWKKDNPDKVR